MNLTVPIPRVILQTVADAANITDDSLALFQFSPQHLDIHLTSHAKTYSMDLTLPLKTPLDMNTTLTVGVDVSKFTNFYQVFSTEMDVQTTVSSSEQTISFRQDDLVFRFALEQSGKIPRATLYRELSSPDRVVLSGSQLDGVVRLAGALSERIHVGLHPNETPFRVQATGDTDHVEFVCDHESIDRLQNTICEPITTALMAKYMQPVQALMPDTVEVLYEIEDDSPLRISYPLPQTAAMISFCLPRVLK